ncbi:MAG: hypothetical protein NWE76_05790 [Candidatus Bathyarchaeota archaeon]|nr:hypothetical protein [Candidatus Bathyarchaeota archaeon]
MEDSIVTASLLRRSEQPLLQLAEKLLGSRLDEKSLLRAGTSGFRWRNDERLERNIGAYAAALGQYLGKDKTVLVGYDERPGSRHSATLCAVILKHCGLDVGITTESVTISCLAKTILERNRDDGKVVYGVMCGASHNPLTDNGMNFIMPDGSIAEEDVTNELARIALTGEFRLFRMKERKEGEIHIIYPSQDYVRSIVDFVGDINREDIVVVVDPLNGAGKKILPKIVRKLGVTCHVVHRRGFEGMKDLDPRTNLEPIKSEMRKKNADLGVLIDGDGDRVMFVYPRAEETGALVEEADFNEAFAVLLEHLTRHMPVHGVSTNIASSSLFRDICKTHGTAIYDKNPVGFKHQSRDMREHPGKVIVGIEGNSGGFTVSSFSHEKDGCLAAALAVRMVAEIGSFAEGIDQLRARYGRRYTEEVNISTPDLTAREERRAVIDSLKKGFSIGDSFCAKKISEIITVDGIKMIFDDNSSLLIRASGTEPKFRVVPETKKKQERKMLMEAAEKILQKRDEC